ncbi:MAG: SDR family oxidoreductase [Clostridia bacterium]|nr:SDR family oxidoreductase [Clostridia bacterium]
MQKKAIITGASRGIGSATALLFAKNGYEVAINYNKSEKAARQLADYINSMGLCATAIKADVSDRAQAQRMFEIFGQPDVLVNNAGIGKQMLFSDITPEIWREMFAVNVDGVYNCCQLALPGMINKKSGRIINISSMWGITGASCEVHYSAAKAAVIGLTKALAKELGPSGITVNCVAPGVIDTDMNAHLSTEDMRALAEDTPLGVIGTAEDIAQTVLFLASDKAKFITGQVISPNGGYLI